MLRKFRFTSSAVFLMAFGLHISGVHAQWDSLVLPDPIPAHELPADIDPVSLARLPQVQRGDLDDSRKARFRYLRQPRHRV